MKNLKIRKEEYEYSFHRMNFIINKRINIIRHIYYWVCPNLKSHHLYIKGETQNLSITLNFKSMLHIPDDEILHHGRRWYITLPKEYDIGEFIYETLCKQNDKVACESIKTFFGISPRKEKKKRHTQRSIIKKLMLSLHSEIKSGILDYRTAATHFSASTGLELNTSLRYFRRYSIDF